MLPIITARKETTAVPPAKDRSPSISPARDPYSRKRKNPKTDHYDFLEDSEDERNDKEFEEFSKKLEDKRQHLSDDDEPKPAPRKMPKPKQRAPASSVSEEEKKLMEREVGMKKRKFRKEIFPSEQEPVEEGGSSKAASHERPPAV